MSKYTRADFQTARFAKHHNGSVASRRSGLLWPSPWLTAASESYSDSNMADNGWFPVPDRVPGRTITEKEFTDAFEYFFDYDQTDKHREYLGELGITVVPDPEPTNAELIERKLRELREDPGEWMTYATDSDISGFARVLDAKGVRVVTESE